MRAWISPLRPRDSRPLRVSLPTSATWRPFTTSSGVVLMRFAFPFRRPGRHGERSGPPCGRSALVSGGEALPAGAAVAHVRIVELEPGSHQAGDEVDLGPAQQQQAL